MPGRWTSPCSKTPLPVAAVIPTDSPTATPTHTASPPSPTPTPVPPTPTPTPTPTPIVQDIFSTGSDSWAYQGTAQRVVDKGYVSLTDEGSPNTVGIVWLETTVTEPFTAEFSYNIGAGTGTGTGTGGDGMVFMFYKNRDYVPGTGGCLGFT